MNANIKQHYEGVVLAYQELRDQLLAALTDEELAFRPSASNSTLGGLCARLAATQQAYVDSFRTFAAKFAYAEPDPDLASSVAALKARFEALDGEFVAALESISDADVANRQIDRGGGHRLPVFLQLDVYREALLIFCGKASVYLAAMGKEPPGKWRSWIWL